MASVKAMGYWDVTGNNDTYFSAITNKSLVYNYYITNTKEYNILFANAMARIGTKVVLSCIQFTAIKSILPFP